MFKALSKSHIVICFLLGLAMSSLATGIFELYRLPSFYELIYLPTLFLLRKDFSFLRPIGKQFISMIAVWSLLLTVAIIIGRFSFIGIISVARSYLLLILFLCIALNIKMDKRFYTILFLVSFGSIVGWALSIQGKLMGILPMGENEFLFAFYGNLLSIPICLSLVFSFFLNNFLITIVLGVNVFLSFTSGIRRQILTSIVSLGLFYVIYFIKTAKFKTLIPVALVIAGVIVALPVIEDKVEEISPHLHHRVFVRTVGDHDTSSEESRKSNILNIIEDADELIFPHGFVSKRTSADAGTGIFVDVPLYELCYTFGMPVVFIFYMLLLSRLIKLFMAYMRNKIPPLSAWFISGTIFAMLLFIEGTMLSWTYIVPFTGLILGAVIRYGNKKRMKEINYYKE